MATPDHGVLCGAEPFGDARRFHAGRRECFKSGLLFNPELRYPLMDAAARAPIAFDEISGERFRFMPAIALADPDDTANLMSCNGAKRYQLTEPLAVKFQGTRPFEFDEFLGHAALTFCI